MSKEETYNQKVTERIQEDPKLKLYVEWAKQNGVIMDKVDSLNYVIIFIQINFPAAFGPDHSWFMGSAVKEDIQHNEAFVYIPNKCLITVERARSSEIGFIFANHENVFKSSEDRDFLTLLVFMMCEFQKGDQSFWYPYFNAVDPGELTCYWDQKYLSALDDKECIEQIREYGASMDEMWEQVHKILRVYSPDYFNLEVCNEAMFKKVAAFIATRCFGWGLPTTILAPIADSFNHNSTSSNHIDFVNKRLHLAQNKIYAYHFNFDDDASSKSQQPSIDDQYDKSNSKLDFNIKRLYKEDQQYGPQVESDISLQKLIEGKSLNPDDLKDRYDEKEVFERFKNLLQSEVNNQDEFEDEESKKEKFPNHGLELWGIGYVSSDYEQDDDEDAHEEEDANDCATNEDLKQKIMTEQIAPDDFQIDEFEQIRSNTRLREIYSYRWWQDDDKDNYFVMVNRHTRELKKGEQIYYNYGKRTNAYLLENYGFVLDESNQYNSLEFRVILGVNPKEQINLAQDLIPQEKILNDRENIDTTTEMMRLKSHRVSEGLFAYLRSILQNNYSGSDSQYLMVSSPRVIDYELIMLDFAIDLLEYFAKRELLKRSTLDQDLQRFASEQDWRMRFILQHNIQRKILYNNHLKLLKVVKAILEQIQFNQETFTRATYKRIEGVEDNDSLYEIFKRRMGMRNYFKELKMNMARIKKSKSEKSKPKAKEFKEESKRQKSSTKKERNAADSSIMTQMSTTTTSTADKKMRSTSQIKTKASSSTATKKKAVKK
eukprot:403338831